MTAAVKKHENISHAGNGTQFRRLWDKAASARNSVADDYVTKRVLSVDQAETARIEKVITKKKEWIVNIKFTEQAKSCEYTL